MLKFQLVKPQNTYSYVSEPVHSNTNLTSAKGYNSYLQKRQ